MNHAPALTPYHNMIMDLVRAGWNATADQRANHPASATRTQLTCPANYLRMIVETSSHATVHCRLGIQPGGTGEPARWHASATAPPASSWLTAARTAHHAAANPQNINLFPGDALTRHGWNRLDTHIDPTTPRTVYSSPDATSHVSYRPSQRAMPALWTITRHDTSISVLVNAAEPRALPALVLALALTRMGGANRPIEQRPDPRPTR